ncbi:MAG: hypothetical protein KDJ75_05060 [Alphaproteobacteria bacterium]|nr:hypothetical protein [Alphaproteobacteria bacterium]
MKALFKYETRREELYKFLLLLSVLAGYFGYLSWEYGLATGGLTAGLTWSFFVLCTPVADAGFLLDFPVRLITGLRMFFSEMGVWVIAITLNLSALHFSPESYDKTFLTSLLHKILTTPWPYWSIILLCAAGTFLSVRFGDEMLDVVSHKDCAYRHKHGFKYRLLAWITFILLIIWAYYHLIDSLNVEIPSL